MAVGTIPETLPAKSRVRGQQITLKTHSFQTAQVASRVFSPETRVGANFIHAFGLDSEESKLFFLNLQIAGLLHDVGKANEGFMQAVSGKKNAQIIRHEHLSAIFMQLPEVSNWLCSSSSVFFDFVLGAVVSHHLKVDLANFATTPEGQLANQTPIYFDHPEVMGILEEISRLADISSPPVIRLRTFNRKISPWKECIERTEERSNSIRRSLRNESTQAFKNRKFLAALKTALIVSDSIASGIVREGLDLETWIDVNVHVNQLSADDLIREVIEKRKANIESRSGQKFKYLSFQENVARLGKRCTLLAGCGAGKTMAGLLWAANQLAQNQKGRVIFLYPTRGTATEGFRDYIGWAPEDEAMLLHGSSRYELDAIMQNPSDSSFDKDYRGETEARLFSLATYSRRFYSATIDQFLAFLSHDYASICRLPLLTDSVVIIDEVHSFDDRLFSNVMEFLRSMDIPTLCMTATLQDERKRALENIKMDFYPSIQDKAELADLKEKEEHPRYTISWLASSSDAISVVSDAIAKNRRVLWVVNTVRRCQEIATRLMDSFPGKVIAYHSRFRLMDRQDRHRACVSKFQFDANSDGLVAVTTQVCEMSLDLDADVLITELAPIEALIQRLGRANRHYQTRPSGSLAGVHVYVPENQLPYTKGDMESSSNFINWLIERNDAGTSQKILADGMIACGPKKREPEPFARLFESGIFAKSDELRDIDEFTVPAILDSDIDDAARLSKSKKPLDGLIVPVPEKLCTKNAAFDWLPKYISIASGDLYSPELGFQS